MICLKKTENTMSKRSRRNHSPAFRAKVALAPLEGDKILSELAAQFDGHPAQITQWQAPLLERASSVFESKTRPLENDFLEGALTQAGWLSAKR